VKFVPTLREVVPNFGFKPTNSTGREFEGPRKIAPPYGAPNCDPREAGDVADALNGNDAI